MNKANKSPSFLSKSTFIRGLQCEKSYYLHKKRPFLRDKLSPEQLAKFIRGTNVGTYARKLFPGGINASPGSGLQIAASVRKTLQLMAEDTQVIYEAAFQFNGVRIALDILVADGEHWRAVEVKSSKAISDTFLWDAALQYYVLTGAGLKISRFDLAHINPDYIRQDELQVQDLFVFVDVTEEVSSRQAEVDILIEKLRKVDNFSSSPDISIGHHCYDPYPCDFIGHCWKKIPEDSVFQLRDLSMKEKFDLYEQGLELAVDIPVHKPVRGKAAGQIESISRGRVLIKKNLINDTISKVTEPVAFYAALGFSPAIPLLNGNRPYDYLIFMAGLYPLKAAANGPVFCWPLNWPVDKGAEEVFFDELDQVRHLVVFGQTPDWPSAGLSARQSEPCPFTDLSALYTSGVITTPKGIPWKNPEEALRQTGAEPEPFSGQIKSEAEAATMFEKLYRYPVEKDMEMLQDELRFFLSVRLENLKRLWVEIKSKIGELD